MSSLLSSLKLIPSQFAAAIPKVGLATGLAGSRLGIDALQGLSGLYDLATPGTGTNRVTKGLNTTAQHIDQTAQNNGINPAYHIMQAALTPASFFAPGAAVSKGIKGADVLGQAIPAVTDAANSLSKGNAAARITGQALQGARPANLINAAAGTANTLGHMSGQGQDINPLNGSLVAALNLAAPLALPAAGQGLIEAGKATPGAVKAATEAGAKGLNVKPYAHISDSEILAAQKIQQSRQGQYDGMSITPQEHALYQSLLQKANLSPNDANGLVKLLNARNNYENTKIYRQGNTAEALKSVKQALVSHAAR